MVGAPPYSDAGTTVGYTNDYDEACPYTGSTSPDVVKPTPGRRHRGRRDPLHRHHRDDTKLFVYQGTCAAVLRLQRRQLSAPLYTSPYVSSLTGLALTGGQTYYFVVDGYGGGSGNYTIEISGGRRRRRRRPATWPT